MRYELEYANSFKKDLKTCKKRGYNLTLLQEVIDLLQTTGTLPGSYRNPEGLKYNHLLKYLLHLPISLLIVFKYLL